MNNSNTDIKLSEFGWNGYKTATSFKDGILVFRQQGWIFFLALSFFAMLPAIIIYKEKTEFSGSGIFLYVLSGALFTTAFFYLIYRQEIQLDFNRKMYSLLKGFIGFTKFTSGTFRDIQAIKVRRSVMNTSTDTHKGQSVTWEIGIELNNDSPSFNFWQSDNIESAKYICTQLSQAVGCDIKDEENCLQSQ